MCYVPTRPNPGEKDIQVASPTVQLDSTNLSSSCLFPFSLEALKFRNIQFPSQDVEVIRFRETVQIIRPDKTRV